MGGGGCPRPTKGTFSFPKLLSCNEPGDTQWRRSTTRITGSNCRRRHAARVTPQRCGSIARVTGSNCQRSLAALPLPLGEVPSAHTGRRGPFSLTTTYNVAALSVTCGDSSPRGRAKLGAVELGRYRDKPTLAAGACPRPTKGSYLSLKLSPCTEPGDPLRWWFTTRVAVSNRQRRHAARVTP